MSTKLSSSALNIPAAGDLSTAQLGQSKYANMRNQSVPKEDGERLQTPVKGERMKTRRLSMLTLALGTAVVAVGLLAPSAMAIKAGYERFAGCPSPAEDPTVVFCQRAIIDGGHFQMGSKDVPIKNPITLSGGINESGKVVANKSGGITPVKQEVPGGIIGITGLDWLVNFLNLEALKLYAVTEIAGQPEISEEGFGLKLPIRVHLINPVLGNNCYVGSFTNPIKLNMTFGTTNPPPPNEPISGTEPAPAKSDLPEVIRGENGVLVDNSFAAPGANGCVLTLFGFIPISINGLVNSQAGLPAAAGTNETKQNLDIEVTFPSVVYP
jgi:hypothetical protein